MPALERPGPHRLPNRVIGILERRESTSVALIGDPPDGQQRAWAEWLDHDEVTVTDIPLADGDAGEGSYAALLDRLDRRPPFDVIVILLSTETLRRLGRDRLEVFFDLLARVTPRGLVAAELDRGGARPESGTEEDRAVRRLTTALTDEATAGEPDRRQRFDERPMELLDDQFEDDIRRTWINGWFAVAQRQHRLLLAAREEDLDELVGAREERLETVVLERLPAGLWTSGSRVVQHGPAPQFDWSTSFEYPEARLWRHEGEMVSLGGQRLIAENTLLPETFRWPHGDRLRHPRLTAIRPPYLRGPRRTEMFDRLQDRADRVDHDVFFADCVFPGHFGHLTTEVLPRLWAWPSAKERYPDLRLLFHTNLDNGLDGQLERQLFAAAGVAPSDLLAIDGPVALSRVVSASPLWHNEKPFYANPAIRDAWARWTDTLLTGRSGPGPERVFVSRGEAVSWRRTCRNQSEVEDFFRERGFHVVCPEDLSLADQAAVFADARIVAGFGGSAMFNLMHCRDVETVICFSHNSYIARNEFMFASLLGADLHYFWQDAEINLTSGAPRDHGARRSAFHVDLPSCESELARLL